MAYIAPIPALTPLVSGVPETPVAAILVGQPHSHRHLVAAKKQLHKREIRAALHPQEVTAAELVAAERRHHRIKMAQFDHHGPDGNPVPPGLQLLLQRIDQRFDRMERRLNRRIDRLEQRQNERMDRLERRLLQETQRSMNRSIRSNTERLEPVIRITDGEVPPEFPDNVESFLTANGRQLAALLRFYRMDVPNPIAERRASLRRHLGIKL